MRILIVVTALLTVTGCAHLNTLGSYESIAPKFKGRQVQEMVDFFGVPSAVSSTGTLQLYEWHLGEFYSEPDEIKGNVTDGGSLTGTVERGGTRFVGCIIRATASSNGQISAVSSDSRTNNVGAVQDYFGCGVLVKDPFLAELADN